MDGVVEKEERRSRRVDIAFMVARENAVMRIQPFTAVPFLT
jgi:hypothetical protein